MITSLREGWQTFASHTWLWVVVLAFTFFNAATVASLGVLGPVVADDTIGRRLWGFVLGALTLGLMVGALLAMRLRVRRMLRLGVIAVGACALLPLALAVAPRFGVLVVAAFIAGVGVEQFGIAWATSMQDNVAPDMLARVYSYDMLGSIVAVPIGQIAAGPAADTFGLKPTLFVAAAIMVAASVGMLMSRDVRRLEHVPAAPIDFGVEAEIIEAAI